LKLDERTFDAEINKSRHLVCVCANLENLNIVFAMDYRFFRIGPLVGTYHVAHDKHFVGVTKLLIISAGGGGDECILWASFAQQVLAAPEQDDVVDGHVGHGAIHVREEAETKVVSSNRGQG
jgi:hypothetical protein